MTLDSREHIYLGKQRKGPFYVAASLDRALQNIHWINTQPLLTTKKKPHSSFYQLVQPSWAIEGSLHSILAKNLNLFPGKKEKLILKQQWVKDMFQRLKKELLAAD